MHEQSVRPASATSGLGAAFQQTLPIILGYVPVGFAYGVLAQKSGLSGINTVLMSILVFAGSGQLIAVGLFAALANPLTIIMTTFIVNLRHLLMSAALAPYLNSWSKTRLALFAAQMTDETFALHVGRFAKGQLGQRQTFGINVIAHSAWVGGTVLGLAASTLITDIKPIGLDYALAAMFIALLIGQSKSRLHVLVGIVAGVLSTVLLQAGLTQAHVLTATIISATFGLGVYVWTSKRSS
ncbi:MAG: AzlC family ABC transporter permease [Desulfovibrionales bacterium]|nr:AzlC family ABC transporter permease [Desulfovibrionales bacterium]